MKSLQLLLTSPEAQEAFGAKLARHLPETLHGIHLHGDLGAGKTTLVRGLLHALGHFGAVKSPTYTLLESYRLGRRTCHHLDLYRIADPEELDYLGLRDLMDGRALLLVEWPERGGDYLPGADLVIEIRHRPDGRDVCLHAKNAMAEEMLAAMAADTN